MFDWFWRFLYSLLKSILYCIDFILDFAKQLVGIEPIYVEGEETDLLQFFLMSDNIMDAFKLVSMVGIVLLFLFTAFAVVRAIGKLGEGKTPIAICLDGAKAILYFLLIPAIMIIGGAFVSAVMTSLYRATMGGDASLGGAMFAVFADEAFTGPGTKEIIIENFRQGTSGSGYYYYNTSNVDTYFSLKDINYFLGYVASFSVLIMLIKPLMTFVERIVSLVLLFIVAPISVSSSVLDGGERFKLWRDEVINKFLIAYGSLLSLNVFVLLLGVIYDITFFPNSNFLNGLARIVFVLGGAQACKMGSVLIGNLVNRGAGSQAAQDQRNLSSPFSHLAHAGMALGGGALRALVNNPLTNSIKKDVSSALGRSANARRSVKDEAARNKFVATQSQKFNDKISNSRVPDFMKRNDWRAGLGGIGSGAAGGGKTLGETLKGGGRGGDAQGAGAAGAGNGNSDSLNRQSADTLKGAIQSGKSKSDSGSKK